MKPSVTVVDYGIGNLLSVTRALECCGARVTLESSPLFIAKAERLVLPGVGAFGNGMAELRQRNLVDAVCDFAASTRPMLGICLGMQMLLDGSDEFGASAGLGLIPGWVKQLPTQEGIKLPHIGWSGIHPPSGREWEGTLLEPARAGRETYFVHSFYADPTDPADCLAETPYGDFKFCSVMRRGNISGCQFHPEKSGQIGLDMISQFLRQ